MAKSTRLNRSLAACSALATALAATPGLAQQVEIGNASAVVGKVEISDAEAPKPRAVVRKERIAWGDLIDTGKKSQLQILLLDRTSFGIGAKSRVRIDRYVYDPNQGRSLLATFMKGALRFFSGRQDGTNSADIATPAGRIGIRGTALDLLVGENAVDIASQEEAVGKVDSDKDEATLVVLRGPGAATLGGLTPGRAEVEGAGKTVVLDRPGLAAYIPRKGAQPIGPFLISNKGLSKVQEELAPEMARAAEGGGLLEALIPAVLGAAALGILLDGDGSKDVVRNPQTPVPNPNQQIQGRPQ
ncbi:hypothetical protein EKN06_10155 [Croceicoccus ponticola]|uniref:FecR protein domain-containing protein n=1 Tax=Croceicoccus ponticola TaxID=2217664 RepID=A0A437GY49_9SPHN|nr:FecR domain-containing protein [Croceicoccus ponticola]RVQ66386.1 hypothetical protein EKN06_10155 [Croceicoccus ponticola]